MGFRRAAAWLLAIPLMVAGSQVAHVFAFRLVYPQAHVRLEALLSTGHGYMVGYPSFLPLLFGVVGGLVVVGFGWTVVCDLRRSRHAAAVPAWAFGLLPPLGFAIQEFMERLFAGASFPWQVVLEPTFRIGLLLQLPFALVAYVVTRFLSRVAATVGRLLRGAAPLALPVGGRSFVVGEAWLPRRAALADGHAGRGPPLLTASH
jgi:hypothetical protein